MRRGWALFFLISGPAIAGSGSFEEASKLYNRTEFEASLRVLSGLAAKNAKVFDLMGKNYFMLGEFKKASEVYEQAVAADPTSAEYEHWLAKAYGKRAETSSPFTAPGLASKARQHFERAVELNPKDKEAVGDLFEFYLQAPGFLGGGLDKAAKIAENIVALDPAEGQWAQARIAERRKDYRNAEEHLRRAVEAAPMQVGRMVDLAKFLYKQGRVEESEQTFQAAEKLAPNQPRLLYQRAEM